MNRKISIILAAFVILALAGTGSAANVSYKSSFADKKMRIIGNLCIRFSRLSSILFIIFVDMVFMQIAVIIGGVR